MQSTDAEIQKAKETITPCFVDEYGRPKRTPYYVTRLQTLFEKRTRNQTDVACTKLGLRFL